MNWKEFFKIEKSKIFIVIAIIFISFLAWLFRMKYIYSGSSYIHPMYTVLSTILLILSPAIEWVSNSPLSIGKIFEVVLKLAIAVFYWHLLSCIIVFIYRKLKSNKK